MLGARRHDGDRPAGPGASDLPPADLVHAIHDRYLVEVVEELGLCPFARRSRELGRVHRPLVWCVAGAAVDRDAAARLHAVLQAHRDAEIVLLTFLGEAPDIATPRALDELVARVRSAYETLGGPTFYMVGFHPDNGASSEGEPALNRDRLVPLLRRTPDPVIQCVSAEVLERVRAQAQRTAHERMLAELSAIDPKIAAIAASSVQPDSELSADIARHNFAAVGNGDGRRELERRIREILAARAQAYASRRPPEATG